MRISVCMATYNGEKYIKEQIQSILSQLSADDELVISDDMSMDSTLEIAMSFSDPRVKIILHTSDNGVMKNFENALLHASGEFIILSDQDDVWMPDKVSKTLEYLREYDFVVSDCITVNEEFEVLSQSRLKDMNIKTGFLRLMIKMRYLGCCMAFRRSVLDVALPIPKSTDLMEHDLWLASVAEFYFKTALIPEPLIYYRRHGENVSDGGFGKGYSLSNKIIRRLYRLWMLFLRAPRAWKSR